MKIWRYEFPIDDRFTIAMPAGAKVLCVMIQGASQSMWAEIPDTKADLVERHFCVFGTGNPIDMKNAHVYIGTIQEPPFVWHVYEELMP